jgi:hypothetical protein
MWIYFYGQWKILTISFLSASVTTDIHNYSTLHSGNPLSAHGNPYGKGYLTASKLFYCRNAVVSVNYSMLTTHGIEENGFVAEV